MDYKHESLKMDRVSEDIFRKIDKDNSGALSREECAPPDSRPFCLATVAVGHLVSRNVFDLTFATQYLICRIAFLFGNCDAVSGQSSRIIF